MAKDDLATTALDAPASIAGLRRLLRAGAIDRDRFTALRRRLLPPRYWLDRSRALLLWLGAALVLAGIVYLFAFNWQEIGRFTKLGSVAGAIAVCLAAAWIRGRASRAGKVLVCSASVLVGVFLAVFGQIYQTGADAWELFAGWSLLILGWVIATEVAALWVFWILLANVAAVLFWQQVLGPEDVKMEMIAAPLCLANCGLLALREWGARRAIPWLQEVWVRYALLSLTLYLLTWPALRWIFGSHGDGPASAAALLFWALVIAGLIAAWWFVVPDILALTLLALDVCLVIDCLLLEAVVDNVDDPIGSLFLVGLATLLLFAGAGWLLREAHARIRRAAEAA